MSERCYICVEIKKGKYLGVYCHNNGEIYNTGELLLKNYNFRSKVEELLSYGDMSRLGDTIKSTIFYKRDKGESNTSAKEIKLMDINSLKSLIRFCYIYSLDNRWLYFNCGADDINIFELNNMIFID